MNITTPPLATRIARGDTVYGIIVKMPAPAMIEMAGHIGFDFVVIDTEHGTADNTELETHLRAADSASIPVLVRIGANDPLSTLRVLDAGATGVIVPHVASADEAQQAVRHAHYPPIGSRGLAVSTRAGHHGTVPLQQHLAAAAANTIVVAQIEDKDAARRAAQIADVPGLNAVWIGPSDLSLSMGLPGRMDHPEVVAAVDQIAADVIASTDCALCVLVDTPEEAANWRQRGARIVLFNSTTMLADSMRGILGRVNEAGADSAVSRA